MSSAPEAPHVVRTGAETPDRRWILALLVGAAAAARLHGLGSQLWLDEMDAVLESIRRPAADIATRWPASTSHVLYDLASHVSRAALGESAAALRLPAALFGVGGVVAVFLLAEDALGRRVAAVAGALLAVSYHHVFYSQNARGYTALVLFGVLASRAVLRLLPPSAAARVDWRRGAAYAAWCALAAYSIVLGVFVLAGHGLVAAVTAIGARVRPAARLAVPMRAFLGPALAAAVVIAVLYAPFARDLARFTRRQAALPAAAEHAHAGPGARLAVTADALDGLARGMGGAVGLAMAAVAAGAGALIWARRHGASLAVLVAPIAVELAALLAADVPLTPRYFALAIAPVSIALACGLVAAADGAARALGTPAPARTANVLLGAAVALAALPLLAYYRIPKQDFRGAMARVDGLAQDGDGRIAVHYAARGICRYYGGRFQEVQALAQLEAEERTGRRLWVVTTLERFLAVEAPALHAHIQASYRRVAVLPATVGGAEMNIYERRPARF